MIFLNKSEIEPAANILKNGGLLAFPTETVYGLGCISSSKDSFDRLVSVKHRNPDKPFTLMCSSIEQAGNYVVISDKARKIASKYMPGPLTLVLKAKQGVPSYIDLGSGFVGIRIPKDDYVLALIKKVGEPLLVPSANISSMKPALNSDEVYGYFKENIDGIVEGSCVTSVPSTVAKIDGDDIIVLRQGPITLEQLKES
jgi:L-threonylcarbamoyladenylate synthase